MRLFQQTGNTPKLKSVKTLAAILHKEKKSGKKIVFTNGCFDLLHAGHVRYLKEAKAVGDVLVVGLNRDASVRRLKGRGRPVTPEKERAEILSALASVDYLTFFSDETPLRLIKILRPDFLVKGGDWKKRGIVGGSFVESYGGQVRSLSYAKNRSTTRLLKKIKRLG